VEGKMNRHERRKANKEERKFLPKGCEVTEVDLTDPDLEPGLRDAYIKAIKGKVAQLDELIACSKNFSQDPRHQLRRWRD
jgi:hypothetical protein